MSSFALTDFSIATSLGVGRDATLAALREGRSGLRPCTFDAVPFATYAGEIEGLDDVAFEPDMAGFDCRNHRIARLTLNQDGFLSSAVAARDRYGAERIGLFLGTSTSGMFETEAAYRRRDALSGDLPTEFDYMRTHNTYALARYVRALLRLAGPAFVISTACAATAKVFACAARIIDSGLCDAAIVGGADSLCAMTLCGFRSLGAISEEPCRPFDADRRGISIGEAAGFVLLERADGRQRTDSVLLLGFGESSDGYHMSSPHPEGVGARLAMERALESAGMRASEIDYINLHGTATPIGDAAEERAVREVFGNSTPCGSTKGFAGHTLGAAGVVDVIFCALGIVGGFIPGSPHTRVLDPTFACDYVRESRAACVDRVISNSFGFGGANCSLVLGRAK